MRTPLFAIVLMGLQLLVVDNLSATVDWSLPHHPDTLVVGFRSQLTRTQREDIHLDMGTYRLRSFGLINADVVRISKGTDLKTVAQQYQSRQLCAYAEPNYLFTLGPHKQSPPVDTAPALYATVDDPFYELLWGLNNTGQSGGLSGADIDAERAWDESVGSSQLAVAIIDTGIDYTHPDLQGNLWFNPQERYGISGVDDDRNGITDDIFGARWQDGTGTATSGDPNDDSGHGTHVAGTVGAVGNNGEGVTGVCQEIKLMALRASDDQGSFFLADWIAALEYAVDKGARISNNSYGGYGMSQAGEDAIEAAGQRGHLFIAAAGNDSINNDEVPHYPAGYELDNIISVASTDRLDTLSSFSNYGYVSVDLAAPGTLIYSTIPGGSYGYMSGTSMASPHVTGTAALILSLDSSQSWSDLRSRLLGTVDPLFALTGLVATGGRLNAGSALSGVVPTATMTPVPSASPTPPQYRMLTIPYALPSPAPDYAFSEAMGVQCDITRWRAARWIADEDRYGHVCEEPMTDFDPGVAYWLVRRYPFPLNFDGDAVAGAQEVPLIAGWNQVGIPFRHEVSLDDFEVREVDITLPIKGLGGNPPIEMRVYVYRGSDRWHPYESFRVGQGSVLHPQEGFFLWALRPCTLIIPDLAPARRRSETIASDADEYLHRIDLNIQTGSDRQQCSAVIAEHSASGYDPADIARPPSAPDQPLDFALLDADHGTRSWSCQVMAIPLESPARDDYRWQLRLSHREGPLPVSLTVSSTGMFSPGAHIELIQQGTALDHVLTDSVPLSIFAGSPDQPEYYELILTPGSGSDLNGDGKVDYRDIFALSLELFNADGKHDLDGDGNGTIADLSRYLSAWHQHRRAF